MCQIVKGLTFWKLDTYVTGMLVSNVCIFIAAFTAVKYLRVIKARSIKLVCPGAVNDGSRLERLSQAVRDDDGMLLVILMLAGPYSFYFASMYTEAAFVMFIALFFYFSAKKKYLRAGIMAALASGTRIVGCILVFSLIIELYMDINNGERISIAGIKNFIKIYIYGMVLYRNTCIVWIHDIQKILFNGSIWNIIINDSTYITCNEYMPVHSRLICGIYRFI